MTVAPILENHCTPSDDSLLDEMQLGKDEAFNALIRRYHGAMIRIARAQVRSDALAEEAVQEAWIAILKGYRRFERRSSLRTWMFRIVINRARTHAARESRGDWLRELDDPSVDDTRFPEQGRWVIPPRSWTPEQHLLGRETMQVIEAAIEQLPEMQQQVITLRDAYGWDAREVCELHGISDANQRILLHRARARVRRALEEFFSSEEQLCLPM